MAWMCRQRAGGYVPGGCHHAQEGAHVRARPARHLQLASGHTAQRRGQERPGRFRPARLLAGPGARLPVDTFGPQWNFWAVVHDPMGTSHRRYGISPLDPAGEAILALLGALTPRGICRHGGIRCQRHDIDISTQFQVSAQPPNPFRRGQTGLAVRDHLRSLLERLSRRGTARASHTGPQGSFSRLGTRCAQPPREDCST